MWADSHCHVHDPRMPGGTEGAVADARANGVDLLVTVGCDRTTSLAAIETARAHDGVHATVGLHPHDASQGVDTIVDVLDAALAEQAGTDSEPVVVAVGEAGLDYYYDHSPRDEQRRAFADQIALAHRHDLPLVIHTRDAWADTFDVLDGEGIPARTVFHCFTGGPEEAAECVRRGAFVSFSGIVTFKGAREVRDAAESCPLERLLLETDSPYLAPVPHRGKPNRPAWVADVGRFVAEARGLPIERLATTTAATTRRFFGLA